MAPSKLSVALWMLLFLVSVVWAQTNNATFSCSDAYKFPRGSGFGKNLPGVLASLLQNASATLYTTTSQGNGGDTVFGLLQCRGDISQDECKTCAAIAVNIVNSTCVRNLTKGGRVQQDDCFLRYEDHFFSSTLDTVSSQSNCSSGKSTKEFTSNSATALTYLQDEVPTSAQKFVVAVAALGSLNPVYALGQCVRDLSASDCGTCIAAAENVLTTTCAANNGGVCYFATCMVRYESSKFFAGNPLNATVRSASQGKGSSNRSKIIGISVGAAGAILFLLLLGFFIIWSRKPPKGEIDELQATLHRGPVTFSYEMLKRCTGNFDERHKLGEGGFGAVYKGEFLDGTEVAIKKLSIASKQGEQQFLNEVKVISSVQHRNLVRLLGCCVEGSERLLVYEFLKNNSLEKALFGEISDADEKMSWERRFSILLGTARGLTYLHQDSQIRIVHRDIKPSNILLDEAFEAKISDFGLARLYEEEEATEVITTKVAGTYGYMAPEYAFHGQLSEKADVFSFGIVILETVSGRRNRNLTLPPEQQYLLEWAWQLHGESMLSNLLDPKLDIKNNASSEDTILQAIQIALMCTQGSPNVRPSMSHVVAMLSGHSNVQVPPMSASFDVSNGSLRPVAFSELNSSASSDSKQRQQAPHNSESFTEPQPR